MHMMGMYEHGRYMIAWVLGLCLSEMIIDMHGCKKPRLHEYELVIYNESIH